MRLYVFPIAPNPTKVRLFVAEKRAGGAALDLSEVAVDLPRGEQNAPEHRARNPFGALPVLELDDGTFLTESLPIMEYLEERFPEPALVGRDPRERARVRELERIADLRVLLPAARIVHATRSPLGRPPEPAVAARERPGLEAGLAYLDGLLADGRPFVAGDAPRTADCTLAAALQFARFGKLELDPPLAERFPAVARWERAFAARPAARQVLSLFPPG